MVADAEPLVGRDIVDEQSADEHNPLRTQREQGNVTSREDEPVHNLHRTDPFQFGTRFLQDEDKVFECNAWDHVEQDEAYKLHAAELIAKQRENPVSDFDKSRFNGDPAKWWNLFYKNNNANFFKNRKWLEKEFPRLYDALKDDKTPVTVLEVGAGNGSSCVPILNDNLNPNLRLHACDFSKKSIEVIRSCDWFEGPHIGHIQADVWDVSSTELPPDLPEGSVDMILMIFIFSALSPVQWKQSIHNIYRLLKPGGEVLFRDYGRNDLAMVRFKKGRYMEENFYIRGDGTRCYFFDRDELANIWRGYLTRAKDGTEIFDDQKSELFSVEVLEVDNRLLVNRSKQLKMYRSWIQGRFKKPDVILSGD